MKKYDDDNLSKIMKNLTLDGDTILIDTKNPEKNLPTFFLQKVENELVAVATVQTIEKQYRVTKFKLYFLTLDPKRSLSK